MTGSSTLDSVAVFYICVDTDCFYLFLQHSTRYTACYDLIGRPSLAASNLSQCQEQLSPDSMLMRHGTVEATVSWDRKSELLQEPPLDANTTLVLD